MKRINECTKEELSDFESLVKPLIDWIKETWDVTGIAPKGYGEFIKNYEDFKGMDDINISSFKGLLDGTVCSYNFPSACSLPHVAYSDKGQGYDPLTILMSQCVSFGMAVQKRRDEIDTNITDKTFRYKIGDQVFVLNSYDFWGKDKNSNFPPPVITIGVITDCHNFLSGVNKYSVDILGDSGIFDEDSIKLFHGGWIGKSWEEL